MLLTIIAGERAAAGVEAPVAVRAVFVPVAGPRLGIAVRIDDSRLGIVTAHRRRPDFAIVVVVVIVAVARLRVAERTGDEGAGRKADDTGRKRVAIVVTTMTMMPA